MRWLSWLAGCGCIRVRCGHARLGHCLSLRHRRGVLDLWDDFWFLFAIYLFSLPSLQPFHPFFHSLCAITLLASFMLFVLYPHFVFLQSPCILHSYIPHSSTRTYITCWDMIHIFQSSSESMLGAAVLLSLDALQRLGGMGCAP